MTARASKLIPRLSKSLPIWGSKRLAGLPRGLKEMARCRVMRAAHWIYVRSNPSGLRFVVSREVSAQTHKVCGLWFPEKVQHKPIRFVICGLWFPERTQHKPIKFVVCGLWFQKSLSTNPQSLWLDFCPRPQTINHKPIRFVVYGLQFPEKVLTQTHKVCGQTFSADHIPQTHIVCGQTFASDHKPQTTIP